MKLSIFGSSEIIYHHIEAAKKNSFNIFGIYSSNKKSKNIKILAKKFAIKKIYNNWKTLVNESANNGCSVVIAGRIKDNKKILKACLKHNMKILIEKPVFTKSYQFNEFLKYDKKIFVGYNRIFYKNIFQLKKNLLKERLKFIYIRCPEINKKNIAINTCHIISIIFYLFGNINLVKKIKNKGSIFCIFKTKKNIFIYFYVNYTAPENFAIEFNFRNKKVILSPIEKLTIYNKLNKIKYRNTSVYVPNILKIIDEYKFSDLKPGFRLQYYNFKRFIKKKTSRLINIKDAKQIISVCNKIAN